MATKAPASSRDPGRETMAVSVQHDCKWTPRGGTEAAKQWQISKYGGTLMQPCKSGNSVDWRCTGCGQIVGISKKL